MAQLSADAEQEASAAGIRAMDLCEDLQRGNEIQPSAIRDRIIVVAEDLLPELDAAVQTNNDDWVFELGVEVSHLHNIVDWQQETALIEWAEQYAEVLDALRAVADGVPPPSNDLGLRLLPLPAVQAWLRAHQRLPIDPEVLQNYAALMAAVVDGLVGSEQRDVQRLKDLGVLNTNDVPSLAWRVLARPAERCAKAAVTEFLVLEEAERRAREAEPGILGWIWEVAGWHSFSDFAFDVGLILVTGGGGAFVKWGRSMAKGIWNLNRIRKSARFAEVAADIETHVRELDRARKALRARARLEKVGSTGAESWEIAASQLQRQARRMQKLLVRYAEEAATGAAAKKEFLDALRQAQNIITKVGEAAVAEVQLRQLQSQGLISYTGKDGRDLVIEEIEKVSAKMGISSIGNLGTKIKDAQQVFLKHVWHLSAPRLYVRWLALLFARQLVVRVVVKLAMNEFAPKAATIQKEAVKAALAAVEESIHDLLPKGLAEQAVKSISKIMTKIVSEITATLIVE